VMLAFTVAASANFPVLFMSVFWRGLTTRGAMLGGFIGLISSFTLVVLGPTVWVDALKWTDPLITTKYPAIYSIPLAFIAIWFFSITDSSDRAKIDREAFDSQDVRCQTGIGAEGAVSH